VKQTKNQSAFTLIEMLTVLVILAFLAQYLVSASMQARERAYRTTCTSNIRQLLQACQMYETDYGELPLRLSCSVVRRRLWRQEMAGRHVPLCSQPGHIYLCS
jgi:prepilin-type N-terminal cleavage/methylation domain-containing protein